MEGDNDSDGDDGHVDAEAQIGEKGAFVGAMVPSIGICVVEEERS